MTRARLFRFVPILLLCACATTSIPAPPTVQIPPPDGGQALGRAREAVTRSDYRQAIDELAPLSGEGMDAAEWAEARYLRGLSLYQEVCSELGACGDLPPFKPLGTLTPSQEERLTAAHLDLVAATGIAPSAEFAAEASYLAGRTLDYGFLQRFEKATELYRWCFEAYPSTPAAIRAKARYDILRAKFKGMKGTPH